MPLSRLRTHFEQEWVVYVRDFPVLLARVMGHGPPTDVREALARNLYEEQTGGISGSAAHPELFLRMMEGCGFDRDGFHRAAARPAAARYRAFLDEATADARWIIGYAIATIFVEGSVNDRREIAAHGGERRASGELAAKLESDVRDHVLVRVHGVSPDAMELVRVHRRIEGDHRLDAWTSVARHASAADVETLVASLERALELWLSYRDEVAEECGLRKT